MPNQLAVALLREHGDEISASSFALACRLRRTFLAIDADVGRRSIGTVLSGVATYLERGDEHPLLEYLHHLIRLRRAGGFDALDFSDMSHCNLPAVRHCFVTRAPSTAMGLAAFEAVESVVLPLLERLFEVAWSETVAGTTQPDGDPTETLIVPVNVREVAAGASPLRG